MKKEELIKEFRERVCDKECPISRYGEDECKGSCLMLDVYKEIIDKQIKQAKNEVFDDIRDTNIYKGIGKALVWRLSNDCVVDEVQNYIENIIRKRHLSTFKKKAT